MFPDFQFEGSELAGIDATTFLKCMILEIDIIMKLNSQHNGC